MPASKTSPGLYANIHAKQERIARGSGETMRKPGSAGAPTKASFDASAKTAKTAKTTAKSKAPAKKAGAAKKPAR
jgi:hypothetical protein